MKTKVLAFFLALAALLVFSSTLAATLPGSARRPQVDAAKDGNTKPQPAAQEIRLSRGEPSSNKALPAALPAVASPLPEQLGVELNRTEPSNPDALQPQAMPPNATTVFPANISANATTPPSAGNSTSAFSSNSTQSSMSSSNNSTATPASGPPLLNTLASPDAILSPILGSHAGPLPLDCTLVDVGLTNGPPYVAAAIHWSCVPVAQPPGPFVL